MNHKLLTLIKVIVLFVPFLFCIRVSAQAAPSLSIDSFSLIEGGARDLFDLGFTSNYLLPQSDFNSDYVFTAWDVGYTSLVTFDDEDLTLRSLESSEKDTLFSISDVYDSHGNLITVNDPLYYGHVDNGFFSGDFYADQYGEIVTSDSTLTSRLINMNYGGTVKDSVEWQSLFNDISSDVFDNSYTLPPNEDFVISERSYYLYGAVKSQYQNNRFYVYVPDMYNPGVCDFVATNGQTVNQIYFNDFSAVTYSNLNGAFISLQNGNYSYKGHTYAHRLYFNSGIVIASASSDYSLYQSYNTNPPKYFVFSTNTTNYDTSLRESNDYVTFKQLQFQDSATKVLSFEDTFDYNYLQQILEALNNLQPSVNPEFDYSKPVSETNYYNYTYVTSDYSLPNSTLPLPGGQNSPITDNSPFLSYDPLIQPTPEAAVQSFWNFQIPFVENLFKKYPFSIPWDVKNFFVGFTSTPQAPAWDFDWSITVLGETYTTHFEGDLSDFEPLAVIFRNLVTISFIVFLAIYSYFKHS